jgi:hypothetical protein
MKRPSSPALASPAAQTQAPALSPGWQATLSVLLAVHLCALVTVPLMFSTRGSAAIRPLYAVLRPYIDLLYLNHGYFFFAPNPGPNHLVRYEISFSDGRESAVGEFPDRQTQYPRLLYHRYFMLSETLTMRYRPPEPAPQPPKPRADASLKEKRVWQRAKAEWDREYEAYKSDRETYERLRDSIANHFRNEYGADDITLIRRRHRLLDPEEILEDRMQLLDKETYFNLPEVPAAEELPWNPLPSR